MKVSSVVSFHLLNLLVLLACAGFYISQRMRGSLSLSASKRLVAVLSVAVVLSAVSLGLRFAEVLPSPV